MNASNNEPIVPLGAEMSLVPEGYKPPFKVQRLYRTKSGIGTFLEPYHARNKVTKEPLYPRDKYEKHDVKYQCKVVLGSFEGDDGEGRTCWLCGFPITALSNLKNPETDEYVFDLTNTQQDDGTCEHVLPVKLAHAVLELLHLNIDQGTKKKLVHTEYEFAHNFCNERKGDEYFISLPSDSRDLCNLEIKESIIKGVLGRIFFKKVGTAAFGNKPPSGKYSVVSTIYNGRRYYFRNIVQAYCFTSDPETFLRSPLKYYLNVWRPKMVKIIRRKMENVIRYIREADNCDKEGQGSHFAGIVPRLNAGMPSRKKGTPFQGKNTKTLKSPFKGRMQQLQRTSSFTDILSTVPLEERVLPFTAPPFNTYVIDKEVKRKVSARSKTVKNNNKNNNNNGNNNNNINTLNLGNLPSNRSAEALGAGAGPSAPAAEEAPVAGEAPVAEEAPKAKPAFRRSFGTRKLAPVSGRAIGRGLYAENGKNGIYISGSTYQSQNIIRSMGGVWNKELKKWILPFGTNLSRLR